MRAGRRHARAPEARPRPGRIEGPVLGAARRPRASGPTPGRPRRLGPLGGPRRWSSTIAWSRSIPALAQRVKALAADPALAARAEAVLRAAGIDPAGVQADVSLSRPRLLSLATFRQHGQPALLPGRRGRLLPVRSCHANHTILRIAEADPAQGLTDEQLMINYNSALKVVNLGEPESSLILRKPRSPQGQGGADPVQPHRPDPRRRPALGQHRAPRLPGDPGLDPRGFPGGQRLRGVRRCAAGEMRR